MKRYIGFLLIIVGFLFVAMGINSSNQFLSNFLPDLGISPMINNILGIVFIVLGLYLSLSSSKSDVKHSSSEVPIYEGEGKKRKIIAYKKVVN